MGESWYEFINYSAEEFKKKAMGRYYVLSWTPVRSIHNPNRCQVYYRKWREGDFYPDDKLIQTNVIVTRPNGAKEPVITHVNTQIAIAKEYEATIKEEAQKPPLVTDVEIEKASVSGIGANIMGVGVVGVVGLTFLAYMLLKGVRK